MTLHVDAYTRGLGEVMFQEGKPVTFASIAVSTLVERCSQIEKELYAIMFGGERFHHYDHKPLECIMKKSLWSAPPLWSVYFQRH